MTLRNALALLLLVHGPAMASDTPQDVATAAVQRWNSAIGRHDLDRFVAEFAPDALLIEPSGTATRGSEQIRRFWQALTQSHAAEYRLDVVNVHREKDDTLVVYTQLTHNQSLDFDHNALRYHYRGILSHVLKRQADGNWTVQVERWNDGASI